MTDSLSAGWDDTTKRAVPPVGSKCAVVWLPVCRQSLISLRNAEQVEGMPSKSAVVLCGPYSLHGEYAGQSIGDSAERARRGTNPEYSIMDFRRSNGRIASFPPLRPAKGLTNF